VCPPIVRAFPRPPLDRPFSVPSAVAPVVQREIRPAPVASRRVHRKVTTTRTLYSNRGFYINYTNSILNLPSRVVFLGIRRFGCLISRTLRRVRLLVLCRFGCLISRRLRRVRLLVLCRFGCPISRTLRPARCRSFGFLCLGCRDRGVKV